MIEILSQPWPWYISGPLIALTMFMLIYSGKRFGMSSNLRTLCAIAGAGKKTKFFDFDWKSQRWNLIVLVGAMIGGFLAMKFITPDPSVAINQDSIDSLKDLGFANPGSSYLPDEIFGLENLSNFKSLIIMVLGGIFVGFGARYAGGCTSGHAISGLSNLQLPSLIAVIGFFIGGLIMVHLLFPLIFPV